MGPSDRVKSRQNVCRRCGHKDEFGRETAPDRCPVCSEPFTVVGRCLGCSQLIYQGNQWATAFHYGVQTWWHEDCYDDAEAKGLSADFARIFNEGGNLWTLLEIESLRTKLEEWKLACETAFKGVEGWSEDLAMMREEAAQTRYDRERLANWIETNIPGAQVARNMPTGEWFVIT